MGERIIERRADEMYIEDFVKYSIIVTRRRAYVEIRDSLKPVQRRTLYDMFIQKATPGNLKKSAKITGTTIAEFHPHGDSSVYDCMAPLAQPWKCKMPLITPGSNFGTLMGSKPADQRYTEVELSQFAMDCIFDEMLKTKYAVNWMDNFDHSTKEPEYLPVKVPLVLINGTFGIGAGTSNSNIPPHNFSEVINATRALIRDPSTEIVLIPDHCNKVDIIEVDKWKQISETGYGQYWVRGIVETEEKNGYPIIHIRSLPDGVTSRSIIDKLYDMIEKKQLPMIKDIGEESNNKKGLDIIITLKKGSDTTYVKEILYSKTDVRKKETVNFFVVDDINPKMMTDKEYLLSFLDFRATTKFRIHCNEYKTNRTRAHKLETYIKVIESGKIDEIVRTVRKQKTIDNDALTEYLVKKLNITDLQADFILSTDVRRLSYGYLQKYKEEYQQLLAEQEYIRRSITDNGATIMQEIDQELEALEKKYGGPRLCKVVKEDSTNGIPGGVFKVVLTNRNYLRKIPESEKINSLKGDNPKFILKIDNTENLLLFDNKGSVFKLPVSKIPITDKSSGGVDVRVLSRKLTSDVLWMCPEKVIEEAIKYPSKPNLVVCTKGNNIKKLELEDFLNVSLSGLIYTKMKDNMDEVTGLCITPQELDVVIYSKQKALRMAVADIPLFKRNSVGSKAMDTNFDVEGISVLYPDEEVIAVVTENGRINLFPASGLPQHRRARQGNNVIKLMTGDNIKSIHGVRSTDTLRITTPNGVVDVPVNQLKVKSGIASGDRVPGLQGPVIKCELAPYTSIE